MPVLANLHISEHAVEQFRKRIAPMSEERTRFFISEGIRYSMNFKIQPDGTSLRIRTRRPFPFEFRAYCVYDAEKLAYVVTTIVRGNSNVTRKQQRQSEKAKE